VLFKPQAQNPRRTQLRGKRAIYGWKLENLKAGMIPEAFEQTAREKGFPLVAGIDEAGRGPRLVPSLQPQ
jgi:hypothetical protein